MERGGEEEEEEGGGIGYNTIRLWQELIGATVKAFFYLFEKIVDVVIVDFTISCENKEVNVLSRETVLSD